jgi:hypothetical protein
MFKDYFERPAISTIDYLFCIYLWVVALCVNICRPKEVGYASLYLWLACFLTLS